MKREGIQVWNRKRQSFIHTWQKQPASVSPHTSLPPLTQGPVALTPISTLPGLGSPRNSDFVTLPAGGSSVLQFTRGPQPGPFRPVDRVPGCVQGNRNFTRGSSLRLAPCTYTPSICPQKHTKPPPHGISSLASVCVRSTSTILPTPSSCLQLGKLLWMYQEPA